MGRRRSGDGEGVIDLGVTLRINNSKEGCVVQTRKKVLRVLKLVWSIDDENEDDAVR